MELGVGRGRLGRKPEGPEGPGGPRKVGGGQGRGGVDPGSPRQGGAQPQVVAYRPGRGIPCPPRVFEPPPTPPPRQWVPRGRVRGLRLGPRCLQGAVTLPCLRGQARSTRPSPPPSSTNPHSEGAGAAHSPAWVRRLPHGRTRASPWAGRRFPRKPRRARPCCGGRGTRGAGDTPAPDDVPRPPAGSSLPRTCCSHTQALRGPGSPTGGGADPDSP